MSAEMAGLFSGGLQPLVSGSDGRVHRKGSRQTRGITAGKKTGCSSGWRQECSGMAALAAPEYQSSAPAVTFAPNTMLTIFAIGVVEVPFTVTVIERSSTSFSPASSNFAASIWGTKEPVVEVILA